MKLSLFGILALAALPACPPAPTTPPLDDAEAGPSATARPDLCPAFCASLASAHCPEAKQPACTIVCTDAEDPNSAEARLPVACVTAAAGDVAAIRACGANENGVSRIACRLPDAAP